MNNIIINSLKYALPGLDSLSVWQASSIISLHGHRIISAKEARYVLINICGIPRKALRRLNCRQLINIAKKYIAHVYALSKTYQSNQCGEVMRNFDWEGEQLWLPATSNDVEGKPMPFSRISAGEFCDATDLWMTDGLKYAPLIISILCKPAGESYDLYKIKERASRLKELPATIAMKVLHELQNAHMHFQTIYPYCYKRAIVNDPKQAGAINITWNDILLIQGNYVPSEIGILKEMNVYDFMAHVNSKNKLTLSIKNAQE